MLGLVEVLNEVLLLMILLVLSVLKYLGQNSLCAGWLAILIDDVGCLPIYIDTHTSSVHGVELIFHASSRGPR